MPLKAKIGNLRDLQKFLLFAWLVVVSGALLSCTFHSRYDKAKEEAETRNSAVVGNRHEAVIDMTGPS